MAINKKWKKTFDEKTNYDILLLLLILYGNRCFSSRSCGYSLEKADVFFHKKKQKNKIKIEMSIFTEDRNSTAIVVLSHRCYAHVLENKKLHGLLPLSLGQ